VHQHASKEARSSEHGQVLVYLVLVLSDIRLCVKQRFGYSRVFGDVATQLVPRMR
jgi:hypothetical protein